MRNLLPLIIILTLSSCASQFTKYKEATDYNLMQCQKMCSSGNVIQIERFNCACNLNNNRGHSENRNYSNSSGNTVYINSGAQNRRSGIDFAQTLGAVLNYEQNISKPLYNPVAPVNNYYNNNTGTGSGSGYAIPKIGTNQFGSFGN